MNETTMTAPYENHSDDRLLSRDEVAQRIYTSLAGQVPAGASPVENLLELRREAYLRAEVWFLPSDTLSNKRNEDELRKTLARLREPGAGRNTPGSCQPANPKRLAEVTEADERQRRALAGAGL